MDPDLVAALKALADPTRLRLLGRLAAGPAGADALARELGVPLASVVRHLGMLRRVGLVSETSGGLELRIDRLQWIGRELDDRERASADPSIPADDARVLRAFIEDGRLVSIPAQEKKRQVILAWLLDEVFTEDREYPEKEVNQRIAVRHPDAASLRRYLVDAGMVTRERGIYRRVERGRPLEGSGSGV